MRQRHIHLAHMDRFNLHLASLTTAFVIPERNLR